MSTECYKKNKKKINKQRSEYLLKNKEKIKQRENEYYQKNKEKIKDRQTKHYQVNKKRIIKKRLEYRNKNLDRYKQNCKNRYNKNSAFIRRVKLKFGCKKCGYKKHPSALDFHHLKDKINSVTKMSFRSLKIIKEEMRKCQILCANCHRLEHLSSKESNSIKVRYVKSVKQRSYCTQCGNDNWRCLDFCNKIDNHSQTISAMANSKNILFSLEAIQKAIQECLILCKNCQRENRFSHI